MVNKISLDLDNFWLSLSNSAVQKTQKSLIHWSLKPFISCVSILKFFIIFHLGFLNSKQIIPKSNIIWSEMGQKANEAKVVYLRVSESILILKISVLNF